MNLYQNLGCSDKGLWGGEFGDIVNIDAIWEIYFWFWTSATSLKEKQVTQAIKLRWFWIQSIAFFFSLNGDHQTWASSHHKKESKCSVNPKFLPLCTTGPSLLSLFPAAGRSYTGSMLLVSSPTTGVSMLSSLPLLGVTCWMLCCTTVCEYLLLLLISALKLPSSYSVCIRAGWKAKFPSHEKLY